MKLKTLIVLALLVPLVVLGAKPSTTHELEIEQIEISIKDQPLSIQINYFATLYGVDSSIISSMVQCESEGKKSAKGDGGRANGVMQYHKDTFIRHSKEFGEELDYTSTYDQIKLGTWAVANGKGREWTSYRAIKNGGKYSFYSKLLQKHFTVYCKVGVDNLLIT